MTWPGPKSDKMEITLTPNQVKAEPQTRSMETIDDHEICSKKIKLEDDD